MFRINMSDLAQVGRGFLMGGADIIPGVSGGTIALILGIYQRLVTAISHFDRRLLALTRQRQWRAAAEHVDLKFLAALGIGIITGILCLAKTMRFLLLEHRMYTLAMFFGLILASSWIVARMVRPNSMGHMLHCLAMAVGAGLAAYGLVGLEQAHFIDAPWYYFVCGSIAICAMILPGISGAYILWLLGAYAAVTGLLEHLIHFQLGTADALSLGAFIAGCAFGLLSFSKLLRWLLARFHAVTMAVLAGFMVGSLRGIWPFQIDVTPDVDQLKLKRYEPFFPSEWDIHVTVCVLLVGLSLTTILLLDRWGRRKDVE